MGCDIHGGIEVFDKGKWHYAHELESSRNYNMFGFVFGVRNYTEFKPLAHDRGLPDNASAILRGQSGDYGVDGHSHSWITWEELEKADWGEHIQDAWIYHYKNVKGEWVEQGGFMASSALPNEIHERCRKGEEVMYEGQLYKCPKITPKDQISGDWKQDFDLMKDLAKKYGSNHVRMVVWFDN